MYHQENNDAKKTLQLKSLTHLHLNSLYENRYQSLESFLQAAIDNTTKIWMSQVFCHFILVTTNEATITYPTRCSSLKGMQKSCMPNK